MSHRSPGREPPTKPCPVPGPRVALPQGQSVRAGVSALPQSWRAVWRHPDLPLGSQPEPRSARPERKEVSKSARSATSEDTWPMITELRPFVIDPCLTRKRPLGNDGLRHRNGLEWPYTLVEIGGSASR